MANRNISAFTETDSVSSPISEHETQVETQVLSTETQVETQVQVHVEGSQTQVSPLKGAAYLSLSLGAPSTGVPPCPRCMTAPRKILPTGRYGSYCVECYREYWRDWQRERTALRRTG